MLPNRCKVIEKLKKLTEEIRQPNTKKSKNDVDLSGANEDKYLAILKAKKTLHYDQARLQTLVRPGDADTKQKSRSKRKKKRSKSKEKTDENGDGEEQQEEEEYGGIGKNEELIKRRCLRRFGPVATAVSEAYEEIAEKL